MIVKHILPQLILHAIVLCLFSSCKDGAKNDLTGETNNVTIIFNTPKPQKDTLFLDNGVAIELAGTPVLTFRGDMITDFIPSIHRIEGDTLTIESLSEFISVSYNFNPIFSMDFIVKAGDSVLIEEKDGFPYLSILNREYKDSDLNHDIHWIERYGLHKGGFRNKDHFLNPSLIMIIDHNFNRGAIIKEYREKYLNELRNEDIWLDSLKTANNLSDMGYDFFKIRNGFVRKDIYMGSDSIDKEEIKEIISGYDESVLKNDTWGFEEKYYLHAVNKYYLMDGAAPVEAIEKIDDDGLITGKLNLLLKLSWFNYIVNNDPLEIGEKYYERLLTEITDTTMLYRFKERYSSVFDDKLMNSDQLELVDKHGIRTTLTGVIQKYEGYVIYVDFWASWCQPCLAEMPSAKRLRQEYNDKKVVFVYLALNDKKEDWLKMLPKAELTEIENSFFIENSKNAPIIKELQIASIPRYLLFDPTGELAIPDAPRPSSTEIKKMIDSYLTIQAGNKE